MSPPSLAYRTNTRKVILNTLEKGSFSTFFENEPFSGTGSGGKTETFAGKWTARVTKIFNQPDGSIIKATRKINKDGSITDKIEHRHK